MKHALNLPTQLLLRDIEVIQENDLLIIGASEPELVEAFKTAGKDVTVFNFDLASFRKIGNLAKNVVGPWYKPEKLHEAVILYLPKSEALIEMSMEMITQAVKPGGYVYVVGEKNAGIKSQGKTIEKYIGPIEYNDSARHSTIYKSKVLQPKIDRELKDYLQTFHVTIGNQSLDIASLPGVFSHGRLDEGTKFFLENFDPKDASDILDWGSGAGIIGAYINKTHPEAIVDYADSNALALEATRKTLQLNNLSDKNVFASDIFSEINKKYDLIVSNPPFHNGVSTDYSMVEKFIAEAKEHLNPGGKLTIVANTFLRYKPQVEKAFGNVRIVAENRSYKIYEARKS